VAEVVPVGTIEASVAVKHTYAAAKHFRRPQHLGFQWKSEAPWSPSSGSPASIHRERLGREGDHVLASVLMRVRVDCSEDGRGAWSDPTEHHHHPQELRNAAARGAERSTRVLALAAGRVASPKADPHPLGLIHVQGQLDGDEQQGDNKLGQHFCALSATVLNLPREPA